MLVQFLQRNKFFRKIIYKIGDLRAHQIFAYIQPFLNKKDQILDIGSGTCNVYEVLSDKGYKVVPLDVQNLSFVDHIDPIIYDGDKIPFNDNKFDKSLILTVLHHTPEPEKIIKEAKRVSKSIIIMEDIYTSWFHKYLTYFFDSLVNLEFIGHPHTNKSDAEWKKVFKKLDLKLVNTEYINSFIFIKQVVYYLEKTS